MQFNVSDVIVDKEKYHNVNIGEFKDSFNLFLGTTNTDIDLFNNPYIHLNVYEITSNDDWFKKSEKVRLK